MEGLEKEVRDLESALSAAASEYRRVLGHNQEVTHPPLLGCGEVASQR